MSAQEGVNYVRNEDGTAAMIPAHVRCGHCGEQISSDPKAAIAHFREAHPECCKREGDE